MENASKALIIAGSILLSILIIALGMYIFSTSSTSSDLSQLTETEIQAFNAKFENYNQRQRGSDVLSLINAVRANATANQRSADKIPTVVYTPQTGTATQATGGVDLSGTATGATGTLLDQYVAALSTITNDIQKSHTYTVAMQYNGAGLISNITINY